MPSDPQPIRVLVVDDSALMRRLLTELLRTAPEIEVVGSANDGAAAIRKAHELRPDVITLDVEMPGVSGLEALPSLLEIPGVSVLMVSALTKEGAETTLTALELGAVDYFPKPDQQQLSGMRDARDTLVAKVMTAAGARGLPPRSTAAKTAEPSRTPRTRAGDSWHGTRPSSPSRTGETAVHAPKPDKVRPHDPPSSSGSASSEEVAHSCVVLGISIGGPQSLTRVLPRLAPPLPPIVIVQHMPAHFTTAFSERLDRNCALEVHESEAGMRLRPNRIYLAPGDQHLSIVGPHSAPRTELSDSPRVSGFRPSIDVLFTSAARIFGSHCLGLIMTGMGRDGVEGCKAIRAAGGTVFAQDEASSVIYGMNKAALVEGAVDGEFTLDELPDLLKRWAASPAGRRHR